MYTLIVLLPLVGFIVAGLFGNRIGAKASEYVTSGLLIAAALLSWIGFLSFGGETQHVQVLQWMKAGTLDISWQLRIDG